MVAGSTSVEKDPVGLSLEEWRTYDFGLASFSGEYRLDVMKMRAFKDRAWEAIPGYRQEGMATIHVIRNYWLVTGFVSIALVAIGGVLGRLL